MRNRSISSLPAFFAPAVSRSLSDQEARPGPLEVVDITFLHFHASMELGVCESGQGVCIVEGREYPFKAGDAQLIFPFQRHLSRSEGPEMSRWYWLNLDPIRLLGKWGAPELQRLETLMREEMGICGIITPEEKPFLAELIRHVTLPGPENRRLACLYALIEELAAQSRGLPMLALRPERRFAQLVPAVEAIETGLAVGEPPSVSALSALCALSPASFRRCFHQAMGQSPARYIQACQMKRAQWLLLYSDASVTQIAQAVGYQDVSGFNRQFLQSFGMPPRQYRQSGGA